MNMPQVWDRHAINAELRRRGMTLTGIAKDAGLYSSACRQGIIGSSRTGAEAIAAALDIPFRTLFPTLYTRGRHNDRETTSTASRSGSAKVALILDAASGAP
ncbi:helix-turn-helix domain-containing protein [Mesorhizobium sp. PAMC28654]|uniref:helix-turn-helix domain-containing protein n=1 Tax=Mesorhizobium sp. PAMC28654 TaxID=2880934 RepID=UPI001D0BD07E|nr:helix-turn-helix domain-containing protein [Mesorhizobium sp. PAMC28654]UDL90351.1 helix-turn-helix domain-containing protein [Mesorhizobium sp. PAMC28654]